MSRRSDLSDKDSQSRKRHWLTDQAVTNEEKEQSPTKRTRKTKSQGLGGLFNTFFGMFVSSNSGEKEKTEVSGEVQVQEDDEIIVEGTTRRVAENKKYMIFLNEDAPVRANAGSEENEVIIEKHVQKNVEIRNDEEKQEVQGDLVLTLSSSPKSPKNLEKSFEVQQDDEEPDVLFEKVVKTPNKQLQEARRFQNELIFLNDNPDTPDDVSVISDSRSKEFISPTPDDSVSRPITPSLSSLSNYTSNNVRDYWRRNSAKKPEVLRRVPVRHQFKHSTSVRKMNTIIDLKKIKNHLSSRDRLLQGVVASGQYEAKAISGIVEKKPKKMQRTSSTDILARAKNKIAELGGSRSNTPSLLSREPSIIIDSEESTSSSYRQHARSNSSESDSYRKLNDILSQINSLGIGSAYRGPQRYQNSYQLSKQKEDKLLEEARIREGHRSQTRGDRLEDVRKRLELQGIAIRPKVEKKKVDDFMALPDAADALVERAWSGGNPNEQFVDAFSIQICKKDLATLSGLHWLNDEIINFYLQLICDRSNGDSKYPKIYAFNTFFYSNIVSKGYASVKRWTRKVDIFAFDIVLVPVHLGMHWCMAVIDMGEKKIEFYDSLYDGNTAVLPALRGYLEAESLDKKKTAMNFSGWTIQQMTDIPRQQNGSDCGVFSCQFGEWASRRTTPRFTQKNMPYYRKRMVYEIVSKKLLATI